MAIYEVIVASMRDILCAIWLTIKTYPITLPLPFTINFRGKSGNWRRNDIGFGNGGWVPLRRWSRESKMSFAYLKIFFLVTQTTIFDRLSGVINLSIRAYLILQVEKIGMLELKLSKLYFLPLVSLTWDNLYCI